MLHIRRDLVELKQLNIDFAGGEHTIKHPPLLKIICLT